jgi:hypothetical protein
MVFAAIAIYVLWKISTNALHGIEKTNERMAEGQTKVADSLGVMQRSIEEYRKADAIIFREIEQNLTKENQILIDRTQLFRSILDNQNKIVEGLQRHSEILSRLEERTRK